MLPTRRSRCGLRRGEGHDRGESRRAFLECVQLPAPARPGVAGGIDHRSARHSRPGENQCRSRAVRGLIKMWLTTNADFQSLSAQGLQRKLENTLTDVRALQKKMSDRLDDL